MYNSSTCIRTHILRTVSSSMAGSPFYFCANLGRTQVCWIFHCSLIPSLSPALVYLTFDPSKQSEYMNAGEKLGMRLLSLHISMAQLYRKCLPY